MTGQEIVKTLEKATLKRAEESRIEHQNKDWNSASSTGWVKKCMRKMILSRLMPEKEALGDKEQISRTDEGNRQEILLAAELRSEGYTLTEGTRQYNEEFKLTGEVEYLLESNGDAYPLDFKSCSSYMFKHISRCHSAEDLLESNFVWVSNYPAQMWSYDMLYDKPLGILLFKDKEAGLKHTVDIHYDMDSMDKICEGLQEVNEAVRKGEIPKPEYKPDCNYCGFTNFCFPEGDAGKKVVPRITDEEAVVKARRFCEIETIGKEYAKLKDELKEQFKGQNVIIEDLLIKSSSYDKTVYYVPQDIRDEYKDKKEITTTRLKNIIKGF